MNRPQLFSRTLSLMFRNGSLWLVALPVTVVNVVIGLVLPGTNLVESLVRLLLSLVTAAFLAGALISLVNAIVEGQAVSAGDGFTAGARTFAPLLLVGLILAIPTFLMTQILDAVVFPLFSSYQNQLRATDPSTAAAALPQAGLLVCCLLPLVLLAFVLVGLVTGAIGVGAERGVALEGLTVWAALKRAWGLLLGRFSDFLVIGLIMLAIVAGIGILFGCPAILIVFIGSGLAAAASELAASMTNSMFIVTLVFSALGIPLGILFSGVWTLAFRRWQGKDVAAAVPPPQPFPPVLPDLPSQP